MVVKINTMPLVEKKKNTKKERSRKAFRIKNEYMKIIINNRELNCY